MSSEATTNLMTVKQAAAELNVNPLAITRVIARRRLPATRLQGDNVRIDGQAVAKYVNSGAKDFALPAIGDRWFLPTYQAAHDQLDQAIVAAAQDQELSYEQIKARYDADKLLSLIEVPLQLTPAIRKLMSATYPGLASNIPGDTIVGQNWVDLYMIQELRDAAERFIFTRGKFEIGKTDIESLYKSPDEYDAICKEAAAIAGQRAIAFSKLVRLGKSGMDPQVTVAYFLRNINLVGAIVTRHFDLAF